MNPILDFGVQSWCFRHFKDNATVAKKIRNIGLTSTELCGVYANFNQPEQFPAVLAAYQEAGVSICSLGVQTFEGQDVEKNWFECARLAGARHISAHLKVDSYMKAIAKIRHWSREYGIRVGLHCHGGYMFGGSPDVLDHLLALGGPEIGLCIDTAWAMQIGPGPGNPVEWAKRYAGRVYGIHFKDFVFDRNGQWNDVVVGTGNLNLPAFTQALQDGGFDGMAVIEYEADVENPEPALKQCVDSMRAALA
ncbi:MAG: sugar phosphate isomerase/epimerase [Blastochloris sp.]|nr:sugar phosphate isomerase/epimerase [Blastochloris sp.]